MHVLKSAVVAILQKLADWMDWPCPFGAALYFLPYTTRTNLQKTLDQLIFCKCLVNTVKFTKYLINVPKFIKFLVNSYHQRGVKHKF